MFMTRADLLDRPGSVFAHERFVVLGRILQRGQRAFIANVS
jgi:hypothetical protein